MHLFLMWGLTIQTRLAWNSQVSTGLYLLSVEIKDVHYHTQLPEEPCPAPEIRYTVFFTHFHSDCRVPCEGRCGIFHLQLYISSQEFSDI